MLAVENIRNILLVCLLGVPEKPQITGFTSPVMEGERMQLTCKTSGSKPAADIRWFKNDKEVKGIWKDSHVIWSNCQNYTLFKIIFLIYICKNSLIV